MYVREAFRLLKKSIIHVETEDVVFDDEEDKDDVGVGKEEINAVSEEDGDNEGVEQQQSGLRHPGEYHGEVMTEEEKDAAMEGGADDAVVKPKDETMIQQEKQKKIKKHKKTKKKKKKTQITFKQYQTISNAITTYLRNMEDRANLASDDDEEELPAYITRGEAV